MATDSLSISLGIKYYFKINGERMWVGNKLITGSNSCTKCRYMEIQKKYL